MTKQQLQEKLTELGVEFDKRLGVKKLEALFLEKTEDIAVKATEDTTPTTDDLLSETKRTADGAETKSGIIIPHTAMKQMEKTRYTYVVRATSTEAEVYKIDRAKREHYVRTYSKEIHGDNYMELAEQFVRQYR